MRTARAIGRWCVAAPSCSSCASRLSVGISVRRDPVVAPVVATSSLLLLRGMSTAGASPPSAPSTVAESTDQPPPPPIVWTTDRLTAEQVLKVDKIFHKVLWLDMIETAMLVELVNNKVGRISLNPKQRIALERRMDAFESGGADGTSSVERSGDEVQEEAAPKLVDVKLAGYDDKQKIKVIKEVRSLLGLGLKEAKELVESSPKILSKQIKPEEADEIRQKLEAAGAHVEVVS